MEKTISSYGTQWQFCNFFVQICHTGSTGKERDEETGYSYFGARYYDSDLSGLFLSVDPMADKYPSISPYAYCAWNPLKYIDPDGDSIAVLIAKDAAAHHGHMAILIQNEKGKWTLWSENGGKHPLFGSALHDNDAPLLNDNGEPREFNSVQDFLNDDANTENHDGKGPTYYTEALVIPTSKKQDKKIEEGMKMAMKWYSVFFNNCAQAVQCAMSGAGVPTNNDNPEDNYSRFTRSLIYSDKFLILDKAVNRAISPIMMYNNMKSANHSNSFTLRPNRR